MKILLAALPALYLARAFAGDASTDTAAPQAPDDGIHRYLIERTFPAGALDGLDAEAKSRINANNASVGVRWIHSFANPEGTKTFCVYEGPSEDAIRQAAALNGHPVDSVTEVPVLLTP
jgi:Protein of unknown function (DUF4242)